MPVCSRCAEELAPDALECGRCHTLVHAARLTELSSQAQALEAADQLTEARDTWASALPLLPSESKQAQWMRARIAGLTTKIAYQTAETPAAGTGARSALLTSRFLLSFLVFLGIYCWLWGVKFGVGFSLLLLIHETGHLIELRRHGLAADMPLFLPGLGAFIRLRSTKVPTQIRATMGLAGPLAGALGVAAVAVLWQQTKDPAWADVGHFTALVNALNLIPIWTLDGGHAISALSKPQRWALAAASLAMCIVMREGALLLVAAGAVYRAFTKDAPEQPNSGILLYFVALLGSLAVLMVILPSHLP